jgi:hypothetical protein
MVAPASAQADDGSRWTGPVGESGRVEIVAGDIVAEDIAAGGTAGMDTATLDIVVD